MDRVPPPLLLPLPIPRGGATAGRVGGGEGLDLRRRDMSSLAVVLYGKGAWSMCAVVSVYVLLQDSEVRLLIDLSMSVDWTGFASAFLQQQSLRQGHQCLPFVSRKFCKACSGSLSFRLVSYAISWLTQRAYNVLDSPKKID